KLLTNRKGYPSPRKRYLLGSGCALPLKAVLQPELDHTLGLCIAEIAGRGYLASVRIVRRSHDRIVKLRVIKRVEKFRAELHPVPFRDMEELRHHQVPLVIAAAQD